VGGFAPWALQVGAGVISGPTASNAVGSEQDGDGWHVDSLMSGTSQWTVSQSNINIPSGTTVSCSAWAMDTGSTSRNYVILIDGVACGQPSTGSLNTWGQFGGTLVVTGDTHLIQVQMSAVVTGSPNRVRLDNVQITALSPPLGRNFCT